MLLKESLEILVAVLIVLLQAKDLEGLLLGYEAALDAQTFLGDVLSAFIRELLGVCLDSLL